MTQMVTGQLFRVLCTGWTAENSEINKTEYLIVGNTAEDVRSRFPYLVDLAEFVRYKIDYVIKESDRAHVLWSKVERLNASKPDHNIKREDGSQSIYQTPDASSARRFSVRASAICFAFNEKGAIKKLGNRLTSGSENIEVVAEEVAVDDGFAKPADQSVYLRASFVRG